MKRIISIIAAVLLALLTCIPAYAAEAIGELPGDTDISIYAKYKNNTDFIIIPTDNEGNGSVTLPSGTQIDVNGADSSKGRLIVDEVTDKEVLDWVEKQLGDKASGSKTYHVYLLDEDCVSKPADGVSVTIKQKDGSVDSVYAVSDDSTGKLDADIESGRITFTTNSTYLYTLCNAAPQQNGFPLWIVLIIIISGATGFAAVYIIIFMKKKNHSEE